MVRNDVDEEEISLSWVFYVQTYPLELCAGASRGPCFVHCHDMIGLRWFHAHLQWTLH